MIGDTWRELDGRTWQTFGSGHINDTFVTDDGAYLLQKINRSVFSNSEGVMRNLQKIVAYVGTRYLLAPIATRDGSAWWTDPENQVWRLFPFAASTRSFDRLERGKLFEAARAFARLVHDLADFDGDLEVAIDGFHDLARYREALARAVEQSPDHRLGEEVAFVEGYPEADFEKARCVIHGDCKVNNLLFEAHSNRVAFVVDLDTVMLGHPAWDFGDLVRSSAAGAEEARGEIRFDVAQFQQIARGYKHGLGGALAVDAFASAPGHMSFMLGVRFLTDHLLGDQYFRVTYPGQNLDRARAQFDLTRRLDALRPEMISVLRSV